MIALGVLASILAFLVEVVVVICLVRRMRVSSYHPVLSDRDEWRPSVTTADKHDSALINSETESVTSL